MNQITRMILYSVTTVIVIIVLLYTNYMTSYDLNAAEKNNKHLTSKVMAYKFDYKDRHIIALENGTQFEQDNLTVIDKNNYNVKKPYKINYQVVKSNPKITYVKTYNKLKNKPHYYILKVD